MKRTVAELLRLSGWPVRWKLAAALWLIAFLPALAAMSYLYREARGAQDDAQVEALRDAATRIASQLSQLIVDCGRMNAFLALDPALGRLLAADTARDTEPVLAALHRVIVANRDVELIMVMDRKGDVVTSTDPDLIGRNFGFREYFKLAVQGRPHVTGFVVGAVSGNTGVYFSNPITTANGKVVGTVVTKILARAFIAIVEGDRRPNGRTAFLLDADNVVVYHPDSNWLWHSLVQLPEKTEANILGERRYRLPRVDSLDVPALGEAVASPRAGGAVRWISPKTGQPERAAYVHIPSYNWTVIVSSEERYLALARLQLERVMLAALGAALVAFGAAFILLRLILVKPLARIGAAARRIARGEPDEAGGELEEIARALDLGADSLQRRQREEEASGRVLLPEIRQKLLPRRPEGNIARIAVLYCALDGIHEAFERSSASEALAALGDYSEIVGDIVKPWGGQINYVSARAVVAVLAAPLADGELESHAVSAALAIQRRLAELNPARAEASDPVAQAGIGVSTAGIIVTGAAGAYERHLNAMLNDGMNVAGSLAALSLRAEGRPLLINHTTYVGVRSRADIVAVSLGLHKLRGRAELSDVYSVAFAARAPLAPAAVVALGAERERAGPKAQR